MLNFEKDYLVAHAILGVQRLRTCVAVPVVTTAQAMATVGGHTIYKVKGTQVLTANGRAPEDKLDARCAALLRPCQCCTPRSSAACTPTRGMAQCAYTPGCMSFAGSPQKRRDCRSELGQLRPENACRLLVHLKDAVDSIGCGAGLHFCTTRNLSCSLQRGAAADPATPLWQRSDSEMWFNAVLSEPLCRAPLWPHKIGSRVGALVLLHAS